MLALQLLDFTSWILKHGSAAPSYVCQPGLNIQLHATLTTAMRTASILFRFVSSYLGASVYSLCPVQCHITEYATADIFFVLKADTVQFFSAICSYIQLVFTSSKNHNSSFFGGCDIPLPDM